VREGFIYRRTKVMILENAEWSFRKQRKLLKNEEERSRKTAWLSEH
jgi:hypothetical protein